MIYGDRTAPESLSAVISDLHPGLDYKINLIALTEHPVGKQRQIQMRDSQDDEAYDSTYNTDDDMSDNASYDNGGNNTKSYKKRHRSKKKQQQQQQLL